VHLIVDAFCSNSQLLSREQKLKEWLLEAALVSGMHPFGKPVIVDFPFPTREGTALSGVIFLGESSITIHTYPEFNFIYLDVFSCLDFDKEKALDFIRRSFGVTRYSSLILNRGVDKEGKPYLVNESTRPECCLGGFR